MKSHPPDASIVDRLYNGLFDEDENTRVCKDIPEDACTNVAHNFFIHLITKVATKTGDALSSPRLVVSWLLAGLGVSPALIGLIVPVREAGSLLPQLAIGGAVRRLPIRKWVWIGGSVLQGAAVLGMAAAALTLRGATAGWVIVALVAFFAVSRGVCSVTGKDLVGKTVPKTRRGRLSGLAASIAGVVALVVGGTIALVGPDTLSIHVLAGIITVAGGMWLAAAVFMTFLAETPGATSGGGNALIVALRSLRLLSRDRMFRRFVVARALLASTVLSMPFYVLLTRDATGDRGSTLGLFIVASSLATAVSGFTWGRFADRSSRWSMVVAGTAASIAGVLVFVFRAVVDPPGGALQSGGGGATVPVYIALYFVLALSHTGIRVSRKTYLVDMAPADERASYVAVSNTVIGVVLLFSGSLGILGSFLSPHEVVLVFAALGLVGSAVAATLKEVE
jgi:hypothetical protein